MSVTPTSDSHTTSADTPTSVKVMSKINPESPIPPPDNPPADTAEATTSGGDSQSRRSGHRSNTQNTRTTAQVIHPDFPDAKTLLISSKRPRSFLERTARELLAGGTETIILSALGDAIPLCVLLQSSLEEKKAARVVKIETTYNPYNGSVSHLTYTAGLRVYMKKHAEFKGSRISPGYVTFAEAPSGVGGHTPIYEIEAKDRTGSVNAGDVNLYVGGGSSNLAFAEVLSLAGQEVDKYEALHKALLAKAWEDNEDKESDTDVRSVQLQKLEDYTSDLKLATCRPCKALKGKDELGATGSVYVSVFKDDKCPHDKKDNMSMVFVVGPRGEDFPTVEEFLSAVKATAVNLMTALCDYNGIARRQGQQKGAQRMIVCRISLFSGGAYRHKDATKAAVGKAILGGLEDGYRHGPAPRLCFAYDEDVFRLMWTETTGLEVIEAVAEES
eukprot:GHVQ01008828.1.p1 GENE.GHVQ01008828.1~~GHVQ01008828.1.p1  ORF type:complete len:444 (-),score=71.34 GHVQ01008828.1:363-1694(-)